MKEREREDFFTMDNLKIGFSSDRNSLMKFANIMLQDGDALTGEGVGGRADH